MKLIKLDSSTFFSQNSFDLLSQPSAPFHTCQEPPSPFLRTIGSCCTKISRTPTAFRKEGHVIQWRAFCSKGVIRRGASWDFNRRISIRWRRHKTEFGHERCVQLSPSIHWCHPHGHLEVRLGVGWSETRLVGQKTLVGRPTVSGSAHSWLVTAGMETCPCPARERR